MDQLWPEASLVGVCNLARRGYTRKYEYQGSTDQTRMQSEDLDHDEDIRRIGELFNLADQSYSPPNRMQHVYKLIRLAPKVNNQFF
jgi:hypothetical protein